jgi:hypothetical protein
VNSAAANFETDIADGEKARKFLGQSVGFENELIGQANFPHRPSQRVSPRVVNFLRSRISGNAESHSLHGHIEWREYAVNVMVNARCNAAQLGGPPVAPTSPLVVGS